MEQLHEELDEIKVGMGLFIVEMQDMVYSKELLKEEIS